MPRLKIRCCCQPQKVLGTLEVPSFIGKYGAGKARLRDADGSTHDVEIRTFANDFDEWGPAIYSEDRPVEFWRKFPTFEEASA